MATPEKDALARHKTEQYPQPEFIDVTATFPGEGETENAVQNTGDNQQTESTAGEQQSPADGSENDFKPGDEDSDPEKDR